MGTTWETRSTPQQAVAASTIGRIVRQRTVYTPPPAGYVRPPRRRTPDAEPTDETIRAEHIDDQADLYGPEEADLGGRHRPGRLRGR